uniref:Uncharacterized protein n=1 Tax=Cyprinus carpio TaxID=7962 RepID=A0A8C1RXZ4_CYPCA
PICACGCEQRACCGDGPDLRNVLVTSVLNLDSYRGHITGFGGQIVGQALVAVSDNLCAPSLLCYFVRLSKRQPLTPCTRRARHKRSLQKRLAVHRALCPSTLIERRREGKDVVEKSVQAIGITAPWRGL